ncbi:MAG: hypothetical protein VB861_02345 [Planctomycetaceae bacterium]
MSRITTKQFVKFAVPALLAVFCVAQALPAAARTGRVRAITKPKFDPDAKQVGLFQGIKDGSLAAQLILKDSKQGNVLIENKTDQPLTVKLPDAVVGVHVLKQGGLGMGMSAPGGAGGGMQTGQGSGGQSSGGGVQGGNSQTQPGGGGMGMFSIPPRKIVRLPYRGVCLEHGKKEPTSRMTYRLIPVDQYSKDAGLHELLTLVARGQLPTPVAQAAAWNINSKMAWQSLAAKRLSRLGGGYQPPYFHLQHLIRARQVVAFAKARGAEKQRSRQNKAGDTQPNGEPTRPARGVRNFTYSAAPR